MHQAADVRHALAARLLHRVAHGEEYRALGERVHRHVQQACEARDRAAHAEGEGDDPHMLDRRVGEHPLDVLLPREKERGDDHRGESEPHEQGAGEAAGRGIGRKQRAVGDHLAADQRIERDVQQQPREHRRNRRWALGVRIRQPVVQRYQAGLGAVTDQQEDEGNRHHRRLERALHDVQVGPQQRVHPRAKHALRREVDQDRAHQRLGDADPAKDEVLPGGFERGMRAIEGDQQHGGERRGLDCHPHDAEVVGGEHRQHREGEELIHAVVQAQAGRAHTAVVALDAHVRARKQGRRQRHERRERNQEDVQRVDEELVVQEADRALRDDAHGQRHGGDEGGRAERDVELGRAVAMADERERARAGERGEQQQGHFPDHRRLALSVPSAARGGACPANRSARGSGR